MGKNRRDPWHAQYCKGSAVPPSETPGDTTYRRTFTRADLSALYLQLKEGRFKDSSLRKG